MFTLYSDQWGRNCEGIHRRELLRVGSLGMAGLTLSNWSRAKAESPTDFVRDKSIVILNLQGGPTQIETFDPKMTAPSEYRAMFGETRTSLSGVTFGSPIGDCKKLSPRNQQSWCGCKACHGWWKFDRCSDGINLRTHCRNDQS